MISFQHFQRNRLRTNYKPFSMEFISIHLNLTLVTNSSPIKSRTIFSKLVVFQKLSNLDLFSLLLLLLPLSPNQQDDHSLLQHLHRHLPSIFHSHFPQFWLPILLTIVTTLFGLSWKAFETMSSSFTPSPLTFSSR